MVGGRQCSAGETAHLTAWRTPSSSGHLGRDGRGQRRASVGVEDHCVAASPGAANQTRLREARKCGGPNIRGFGVVRKPGGSDIAGHWSCTEVRWAGHRWAGGIRKFRGQSAKGWLGLFSRRAWDTHQASDHPDASQSIAVSRASPPACGGGGRAHRGTPHIGGLRGESQSPC